MTNEQTKTKHPYYRVLQWVAEGKEIEAFTGAQWITAVTSGILNAANHFGHPEYYQPQDFRIKPKVDNAQYAYIVLQENGSIDISHWTKNPTCIDNLKVVFDSETNKIKSAEIIESKHD
jgi:hypothetical protein